MRHTSRADVGVEWIRTQHLRDDRNIAGLLQQLDSPLQTTRGSSVREAAAKALGELGEATAVPRLLELASDSNERVRFEVMVALGRIGDPRALAALIRALDDTDRVVRLVAVRSLGQLGLSESMARLEDCLGSDDPWMRLYAAEALASIDASSTRSSIEAAAGRERPWNLRRRRRWRNVLESLRGKPDPDNDGGGPPHVV